VARATSGRRLLILVAVLATLHFVLGPLLEPWFVKPNLLLCALLIAARYVRPAGAAALGLALGILEDAMAVSHFGMTTLVLVVIGYAASQMRDLFLGEEPLFVGTYLLIGTWLYETLSFLLMGAAGNAVSYLLVRIPLDGLITAALGYAVLPLVKTH
jgi:rod shape-determining protein MreD